MKVEIEKKVEEIAECIIDKIDEAESNKIGGLYDGEFGIILFLFYYSKYTNNGEIEDIANSYVESLLSKLVSNNSHTFCGGLSGILYLFEFLRKKNIVDIDISDAEEFLESFLINRMRRDIQSKNYDFLHGALGVGYYFLRTKLNNEVILELITYLHNTAEINDDTQTAKWESLIDSDINFRGYNISLAHGMSSIVLFLSKAIELEVEHSKIGGLLNKTVNYILEQEIDYEKYDSYFPNFSIESSEELHGSRLAWCYGDLGIAYSLWYAGRAINNKGWESKGLKILLQSTKRRTQTNSKIVDAGLCHGSAGLIMIYRHMYLETENKLFLSAIHYWVEQTINLAQFEDGLAGYKSLTLDKWNLDYSLLTGISGIGLVLISYLSEDWQGWDDVFLL